MSRLDNRWFGHETWIQRHKRLSVGLFLIAILLFILVLGYICCAELKMVSGFEKTSQTEGEKTAEKEDVADGDKTSTETEVSPIDPDKPMIAITFDDGPSIYTEQLLDKLKECNARATFFMVGQNVRKYPDTVKRIAEMGCEIGNHTYNHVTLTELAPEQMQSEIEATNQALTEVLGQGAKTVRPTYGAVNDEVKNHVAYPFVMWSVDTTDWQKEDAASVVNYVLETVQDGDIVLLHDIHAITVEAMMTLIPALQERGYQLVTVSEMAEVRGITFENGQKYFSFKK